MYIIRFQKYKYNRVHKDSLRLVVIKQGKAPNSGSQVAILGYYNKKKNVVALKLDLLLLWLSLGVTFSNSTYKLLHTLIKI